MKKRNDLNSIKGTETTEFNCHGCQIVKVSVKTEEASKLIGKEIGDYITIHTGDIFQLASAQEVGNCLAEILNPILAPFYQKRLCICGLGNQNTVSDSLGPATIDKIPAQFLEFTNATAGNFEKLITIKPDVQGNTNLETVELVAGIAAASRADCLLLLDSIGVYEKSRLCNNFQISTAGGTRHCFAEQNTDWSVIGLPVISIGVPLVLSAEAFPVRGLSQNWFTPCNVREAIDISAAIIAYALVKISYPNFQDDEYINLTEIKHANTIW